MIIITLPQEKPQFHQFTTKILFVSYLRLVTYVDPPHCLSTVSQPQASPNTEPAVKQCSNILRKIRVYSQIQGSTALFILKEWKENQRHAILKSNEDLIFIIL